MSNMLTIAHVGNFSGSAPSLIHAVQQLVPVERIDLLPLARRPRLLPWRVLATLESYRAGPGTPWTKTEAWSRAVEGFLRRGGVYEAPRTLLVLQTLPALSVPGQVRYGVYTDRVAREGAAVGGPFASRFSSRWLAREQRFLEQAHRVYVMGRTTSEVLVRDYGLPASNVRVVGAGPNAPLSGPVRRDRCRRWLFVGTDWHLKGGPDLLAAFGEVRARHPDAELMVVGCAPSTAVPDGVHIRGRVRHDKMDRLYSEADALVIPTHMEAFGISLLEGLLKGLPCVGSTIGNQPWLIGDAGLCVQPGDPPGLTRAMTDVIRNYSVFSEKARVRGRLLRPLLSWERVACTIIGDLVGQDSYPSATSSGPRSS